AALAVAALGAVTLNRDLVGVFYDDGLYAGVALALARGLGYVHPHLPGMPAVVHYPPLYPLVLAPLFGMFSVSTAGLLAKVLNLALNAVTTGLVTWHATRTDLLGPEAPPWLAAALVTAAGLAIPMLAMQAVLFSEPLFGFLVAVAVILADAPPARLSSVAAAGLAGLAAALAPAAPPVPPLRGTDRGGVTVGSRPHGATLRHRLEPRALPRDPGRVAVRERPVPMDHAPLDSPHRSQRWARAVATPAVAFAPHAPRDRARDRVDAGRSARVRRTLVGHDGSRDLRQLHGAAALGQVASRRRGARDRRRSVSVALHGPHLRAVLRLRVSGVGAHDPGSPGASRPPRAPAHDAYPARRRGEWVG